MALVLADRVRDTTTTTGTGTVTLSGTAPTGYQNFSTIGNGNTTYYTINAGSQWEVGIGTYSSTGPTLSRDTVLSSSSSGSLVDFSAGTKDVFVTYPSGKSVNYDASGNLVVGQTATQLQVTNTASAVNYIQITGSATGSDPTISAQGSDTDRNLKLTAKGTGAVQSTTRFEAQTGAANYWRISGAATTATPVLSVLGSDTNINMGLTTKGTGSLIVTTNGSERFRVDGSGRFGFGTSSPAAFTTFTAPATSAAAWTTSGINMVQSAATFTDTTSSGTVTDIRINNFAAQTLAASNPTTVTVLYGTYFTQPAAGTNVTLTSQYALGTDSLRVVNSGVIAGVATLQNAVTFSTATAAINLGTSQTTGTWTAGGASQTGTITLGQSTVSQTTNIQAGVTASGSTKTINIGTSGASGSTTAITVGSATSGATQTTTINGRVTLAPIGASAAAWTTSGIGLIQSAATFTDTTSTGTVADIRINNFAAQTLAASNTVTASILYGTYFANPAAGTNVTLTSSFAVGADNVRVNGILSTLSTVVFNATTANIDVGGSQTSGTWTAGGTSGTGTITLGRSTLSQTTNIQAGVTASGSTKTINIGTNGASGSTTAITIGGTAGTSTTTLNGTVSLANALAVGSGGTGTATTFTAGSIVFAGASGVYSQNNAQFFWDNSSFRLGVGNASPGATLDVTGNIRLSAGSPNIEFNNGGAMVYGPTGNTLAFATGGGPSSPVERMRITSTGVVGIGISGGDASLHIVGIRGGNGRMTQSSTGGTSQDNLNIIASSSSGGSDQWFSYGVRSDNLFFIQNGVGSGTSGLVITNANNVLINESSPSSASLQHNFEVNGDIMSTGSAAGLFWANRSATPSSGANWYGWYTASGTIYLYNPAAGNIASINASTGAYTALSDAAKKKDFEPSAVGLDAILALKPTLFRMETDADDAPKQLGFIAQEVKDHIPQAYVEEQNTDAVGNENTYIGLTDRPIIAALVKAVQELEARVAQLEGK